MMIAVLSGKGGTGKTTVSASLARVIPDCYYLDCDVEEPNGALFLKPDLQQVSIVTVLVPEIDPEICTLCGACADICQFHALATGRNKILKFPELCHHCGACGLVCQPGAIREVPRRIGVIEATADQRFMQGRLDIGEPVGVPIITALKRRLSEIDSGVRTILLDCPPGASCSVVHALDGCDFALLVTEPTPFGLHDLKIATELVGKLGIRAGVVLNKAGSDNSSILDYCEANALPVLMQLPFSRAIAEGYANASLPVDLGPRWKARFAELAKSIEQVVAE
jgi:MinD superfamily P-loop ATPase